MDRRQLLRGTAAFAAALPAGIATAILDALGPAPAPARVGAPEITAVRATDTAVHSLSFTRGGEFAARAGLGQLEWATGLLSARCPEHLRPDLYGAVARLADTCGFAAFDAMWLDRAERLYDLAESLAAEANDVEVLAEVRADRAWMRLWAGDPLDALAHIDRALAADHVPATARARLLAMAARAHAQMGDRAATERHVGLADEAFPGRPPSESWFAYYDEAEHASSTAHAFYDLTLAGGQRRPEAAVRERQAVEGYGEAYPRSRMLAQARLATVTMELGDPDEAAAIGLDAVNATTAVRSGSLAGYLRTLHRVSTPHAERPAVAEMRARVADALLA